MNTKDLEASIASIVTIIFFVIWSFFPDTNLDVLSNFVPAVVSVGVVQVLPRVSWYSQFSSWKKILSGIFVTILIMGLPLVVNAKRLSRRQVPWYKTQSIVQNWRVVQRNTFTNDAAGWGLHVDADEFATSTRSIENGQYIIHVDAPRDATSWASSTLGAFDDFYLSVEVTKLSGPQQSYCGVLFRYEHPGSWLFFRLGSDQSFSISRNLSRPDHQQIAGPEVDEIIKRNGPNTVAILAQQGRYQFFVNRVQVYVTENLPIARGGVDLAAQAPRLPSIVTCAFDNFELRVP